MKGIGSKSVIFFLVFITVLLVSCGGDQKKAETIAPNPPETPNYLSLTLISERAHFNTGDTIPFGINLSDKAGAVVSYKIIIDSRQVFSSTGKLPPRFTWHTDTVTAGSHELDVNVEYADHRQETQGQVVILLSDVVPKEYKVNVVRTFPHDVNSYTQGLIYENGVIYEGTGQYGKSKLRKLELESGKVLQEISIPDQFFGEGISLFKNKIFQLTWKSQKGFIYDPADFKQEDTFAYPTEGWGITHDDQKLIVSDGTAMLYFYDEHFSPLGKLAVYDHEGPVSRLNELEYINGLIYANIYMTDRIVEIDPKTGKVIARIDLTGLLKKEEYTDDTDVLNGIAWDAGKKRLIVTGKNWPKMFEIRLEPVTKMGK